MPVDGLDPQPDRQLAKLVSAVFLAQVCALCLRSWLDLALRDSGVGHYRASNLSYFIVAPILIVLLWPVWRKRLDDLYARFRICGAVPRLVCIGVLLGFALRLAVWGGILARTGFGWGTGDGGPEPDYIFFSCPPVPAILLALIAMCVLAPLTEEIINRAWLACWLRRYGDAAAIIGSALAFAVLHLPQAMAAAFFIGLFLARLIHVTGSLWAPLSAHAVYNSLVIVDWDCLRVSWQPADATSGTIAVGLIGAALAIAATGCCAVLVSKGVTGTMPGDPSGQKARATRSIT